MAKSRLLVLLPLCCGLALGCGQSRTPARLQGEVKYNGQLVKGGTIQFHSKEFGIFQTTIRDNGTYAMSDLPAGEVVVTIETESVNPDREIPQYGGKPAAPDGGAAAKKAGVPPPPAANKGNYVHIPERYRDPAQSGLTVTLGSGSQTQNFDLKE
jgi:hypothetical protein